LPKISRHLAPAAHSRQKHYRQSSPRLKQKLLTVRWSPDRAGFPGEPGAWEHAQGPHAVAQTPTPFRFGAGSKACRKNPCAGPVQDLKFPLSIDGEEYHAIASRKNIYIHGGGGYGYWTPAVYGAEGVGRGETCFKIERTGAAQNGRVEIRHSPARHRG
jgi:hypothetical protein